MMITRGTSNYNKLMRLLKKTGNRCMGVDLERTSVKIDNEIKKFCNNKGWTIKKKYIFFTKL